MKVTTALFVLLAASGTCASAHARPTVIDDLAPGWIWNRISVCDMENCTGGTVHAGGPGSYAAYTFQGSGVSIYAPDLETVVMDGRTHKIGRYVVKIDGKTVASMADSREASGMDRCVFTVSGLPNAVHVLQIEPESGWIAVDYITVDSPEPESKPNSGESAKTTAYLPDGVYQILVAGSTTIGFDVAGKSTVNGTELQIYKLNDWTLQPNQMFRLHALGDGSYIISPLSSPGKVLSVLPPPDRSSLPRIGIWDDLGTGAQRWALTPGEGSTFRLTPRFPESSFIEPIGNSTANGVHLECCPDNSMVHQAWAFKWISN